MNTRNLGGVAAVIHFNSCWVCKGAVWIDSTPCNQRFFEAKEVEAWAANWRHAPDCEWSAIPIKSRTKSR